MIVSFKPGVAMMNGETALEFVRSRHATGIEGSDIAREARQQLIINAIVKKAATPHVITNFSIDQKLLQIANSDIKTDLKPGEVATLARYLINAKVNMKSYTIPDELLYNPPNEYKYFNKTFTHFSVFIPNNKVSLAGYNGKQSVTATEDWSDVQSWVKSILP